MSEKRLLVNELHAPARTNFPRRHFIVHGYEDLWQADVIEMCPYMRFNRAKNGNEVMKAIAKIIPDDGTCLKNLHTDKEKEFYNSDVQKLLKKHSINHYSVMKASIVERFKKNDMWE
ncbi:PREDICTED: uncharacterized protein LOC105143777 [Acromyrmex echinatior]|uniref:uncharacterized protein LOC105143777 n=1 Tax=Acromyrmex echinatior TaxID=103372 RepID=UPI000580F849|nr:PREDICTED: uncharacterized protein LOC105143777 [Acromyrmex echinatior]